MLDPSKCAPLIDRILIVASAIIVFTLPLFTCPALTDSNYGKSIASLIATAILAMLWGISGWMKGSWNIRLPWITFPVLGFVLACLLSLLNAINGRVVIQSLVLVVFFFLLLIIVTNIIRARAHVHLLLFALLSSGFLASLYGLLQYLGVLTGPFGKTGLNEIVSTFGNRNYLGGFLAYLLFPAVILVINAKWRWVRSASILMIAFCFGMALLMQQTAIVVSLIVTSVALITGLLIFRPCAQIRKNRIWILILLALLAITFLVEAPSSPLNSIIGLSAERESYVSRLWRENSGGVRAWDWWVGWEMFTDSPVVGVGLGNYKLNFLSYKAEFLATPRGENYSFYIPRAAQAHNDYVQALAELGIVGALTVFGFLAVLVASFWLRILRTKHEEARLELLLLSCGIIPIFVHALVSFPAHLPASSLVFVTIIGLTFSRVYGEATVRTFSFARRPLKLIVFAVSITCIVVSVIAVLDLSADILMNRGIRQSQLGNSYSAEALLSASLRYDFAPRQTYYYLASVQLRLDRFDEAWENLELCMTRLLSESVYLVYANLGANRGELEKAQAAIDILLSSHPSPAVEQPARYIEAVVAIQRQDYDYAIQLLEALTHDHASYETGFVALGDMYASSGLTDLARESFEKALRLIDRKLATAAGKLNGKIVIAIAEYGEINTEIELLNKQREIVIDQLGKLPVP